MCGIAGVISADVRIIRPAVKRMLQAIVHRGPDDEGYQEVAVTRIFGNTGPAAATAGLGFRRLAIMDLSLAGHQPMHDPRTGNWLIFNGEIYNFKELRSRLPSGNALDSSGDTAVLLQALSTWGEGVLDELDGMFAFAFYEAKRQRILLARDHLGIKPLYIGEGGDAFVFASEIRAILASGLVPDDLDPAGIAGFLSYGSPQDPLTVHRHIQSLPAGACRWIGAEASGGGQSLPLVRYWRFPATAETVATAPVPQVRSLLAEAVQRQCVADAPLGAFLSGGIDSAAVVSLAQLARPPIDSFSVGFECAGGGDEAAAAAETAHAVGSRHRQTIMDDAWVALQWSQWIKAADRPTVDGLNTYIVSGAVKDLDISVALSGLGADELFCGYSTFASVPRLRRMLQRAIWLPAEMRRVLALIACLPLSATKREKAAMLSASGIDPVSLTLKMRRMAGDGDLRSLGLRHRDLGLTSDFIPPAALEGIRRDGDVVAGISQAELVFYMGNTLLRDADVYSMAHSLEIRVPFLARPLVDAATRMPGTVRAPAGTKAKYLLREAMKGIVPDPVFQRPKTGFTLPLGDWLAGPLRNDAAAAIDALAACPILPEKAVRRLWGAYSDPRSSLHWSRSLSLVALGSYLIQHRERASHFAKFSAPRVQGVAGIT